MEKNFLPDPAPLHNIYREYFNLVDLADRYWYSVQETHPNICWKSKLLLGNMRFGILNAWVLSVGVNYEEWKEFRANLARVLISYKL